MLAAIVHFEQRRSVKGSKRFSLINAQQRLNKNEIQQKPALKIKNWFKKYKFFCEKASTTIVHKMFVIIINGKFVGK